MWNQGETSVYSINEYLTRYYLVLYHLFLFINNIYFLSMIWNISLRVKQSLIKLTTSTMNSVHLRISWIAWDPRVMVVVGRNHWSGRRKRVNNAPRLRDSARWWPWRLWLAIEITMGRDRRVRRTVRICFVLYSLWYLWWLLTWSFSIGLCSPKVTI